MQDTSQNQYGPHCKCLAHLFPSGQKALDRGAPSDLACLNLANLDETITQN